MSKPKLNVEDSVLVYEVFREIVLSEDGAYNAEICEKLEKSQGTVGDALYSASEADLLKKGRKTRAQYYLVNWEGLKYFFTDLFNSKVILPDKYLKDYILTYTDYVESSSMKEMLQEDLLIFLDFYKEVEDLPNPVENFMESLSEEDKSKGKKGYQICRETFN